MKKQDDNELDYNIVFNDEIASDDFVDDDDDEREIIDNSDLQESCKNALDSNNDTATGENFYSNYFNHKVTHCDCEDENCEECHEEDKCEHERVKNCRHTHSSLDSCSCGHEHQNLEDYMCSNEDEYDKAREENLKRKLSKYKEFEFDDETDFTCELDPNKICDNCGICLDSINTDKDGYTEIKIDKIDKSGTSLDELYKMYGLDDD